MASALHFSNREWIKGYCSVERDWEWRQLELKRGNLVLISVSYLNYTMTDHKGRLLSYRQLKLCTAVYWGHFRSGVMHEWYSYTAEIQLMVWVWSHGLLLMLHAWSVCYDKIWNPAVFCSLRLTPQRSSIFLVINVTHDMLVLPSWLVYQLKCKNTEYRQYQHCTESYLSKNSARQNISLVPRLLLVERGWVWD